MGVVLAWASNYPTMIDTIGTNFPAVSDGVHDVLSSHVNSMAQAIVGLENVVGGLRNAVIQEPLTLNDGDSLIWVAANSQFEAGTPAEAGNIGAKAVDLTGLSDGDIVVYDLGSDTFIRAVPASGGGGGFLTGAGYAVQTALGTELIVGGFVFDPSALTSPTVVFELYGVLQVAGAGTCEMRLYDMGPPGTPAAGDLRSTLTIANIDAGANYRGQQTLTVVGAAPAANEILNAERMYELRLILLGAAGGDVALNLWSGLKVS